MSERAEKNNLNNIHKIGIFGDYTVENKSLIKNLIFELHRKLDKKNVIINSLGGYQGTDKLVKKYALELGFSYREHNPVYTGYTLYSYLHESRYNQQWHPARINMHIKPFIQYCDRFIVIVSKNNTTEKFEKQLQYIQRQVQKVNKPIVLIQDIL